MIKDFKEFINENKNPWDRGSISSAEWESLAKYIKAPFVKVYGYRGTDFGFSVVISIDDRKTWKDGDIVNSNNFEFYYDKDKLRTVNVSSGMPTVKPTKVTNIQKVVKIINDNIQKALKLKNSGKLVSLEDVDAIQSHIREIVKNFYVSVFDFKQLDRIDIFVSKYNDFDDMGIPRDDTHLSLEYDKETGRLDVFIEKKLIKKNIYITDFDFLMSSVKKYVKEFEKYLKQ